MNYNHYFLSDENCAQRLIREYTLHGSLAIAYDFDNTVHDYHKQGHDYTEMVELLRELKAINCVLIVFTAAEDLGRVSEFLTVHDIPFDLINENPSFYPGTARKIYYNVLLDDRAGLRSAFIQCRALLDHVRSQK